LSSDYVLSATSKDVAASITPRVVTLSASKTYDGTAALSGSQVSIGNLVGSETLTYSGAAANDALVGTANKFIQTITLGDGTNGGLVSNYQLPNLSAANAAVTIRERVNTVAVTDALFLGISYVPANQGIFAVTTFTTQPTPQVTGATGTASSPSNLSVPITAETIFGSTINYAVSGYGSGRDSASSNIVASSSNVGLVSSDILTPVRQKFADQTTVARASSFADLNSSATDRTSNEGTTVARPQTTNTNTVDTPARDVLAGGFKENELKVSTVQGVDNQSQGAVKVDVPETLSKGFVFEMPQEFKDLRADTGVTATATQQDGSALPSWLSFDGESLKFSASAVPAGSLPFTATVRIGDKTVVVEVTESSLGQ
jgi:YDG domain